MKPLFHPSNHQPALDRTAKHQPLDALGEYLMGSNPVIAKNLRLHNWICVFMCFSLREMDNVIVALDFNPHWITIVMKYPIVIVTIV